MAPTRAELRRRAGDLAVRAATRLTGRAHVAIDYPARRRVAPRYGHGRPEHAGLAAALAGHEDAYARSAATIAAHAPALGRIELTEGRPGEPFWHNFWLPALDGAALYAFLRERRPAHYVEVGAGHSTRFAARARRDGDLPTCITSIDPAPRLEVDALCDDLVRARLEDSDLGLFDGLEAGDIVFLDSSHRVFMGSDVTTFFLEVLPRLPAGLLLGIHDVFLPEDYLPEWGERDYAEQYLLAMLLLSGTPWLKPVFAARYVTSRPGLAAALDPLWAAVPEALPLGFAFWLEIGERPAGG